MKQMRQLNLFLSLKRDIALVSSLACLTKGVFLYYYYYYYNVLLCCLCVGYPRGFVVKQWVKDVRSEARAKANLRVETNKALGFAEQKNQELTTKLIVEERAWKSVEVGLKNALDLVED